MAEYCDCAPECDERDPSCASREWRNPARACWAACGCCKPRFRGCTFTTTLARDSDPNTPLETASGELTEEQCNSLEARHISMELHDCPAGPDATLTIGSNLRVRGIED